MQGKQRWNLRALFTDLVEPKQRVEGSLALAPDMPAAGGAPTYSLINSGRLLSPLGPPPMPRFSTKDDRAAIIRQRSRRARLHK